MKPSVLVTIIFFLFVALLHLARLVYAVPFVIGTLAIPMWVSVVGVIGPCALAGWLWKEGSVKDS